MTTKKKPMKASVSITDPPVPLRAPLEPIEKPEAVSKVPAKVAAVKARGEFTDAERLSIAKLALTEIGYVASTPDLRDIARAALAVFG